MFLLRPPTDARVAAHLEAQRVHDLLAFSRPGHPLAWLGYPWTRSQQRRSARGSMAATQAAAR